MTNRLELNWKLDGFVDEQRYYCSETPIDVNDLPTAKAILSADVRTYLDTTIETGKKYYVRIGSVKNGVEKISAESTVNTMIDGPRNIAIVTDLVGNASPVALKGVLETYGHTVTIVASGTFTLESALQYDLLIGSRVKASEAESNVIVAAFNAGIPVLCSNHAGTGQNPHTWSIRLRLLPSMLTTTKSDNSIYRFADYANIFAKVGITLPDSSPPYTGVDYSCYTTGSVAPGAVILAYRNQTDGHASIVVAEKGSLNLDGSPFPAKIAFIGAMFNQFTQVTKDTINETIKWLTR